MREMTTVRKAVAGDAEGIARVHTSSWQAAYRGLVPGEYLDGLRWETRHERWSRELADSSAPASSTLVAVSGDNTVEAFASYGPLRGDEVDLAGFYELYAVYAMPELWGQHVGAALLSAVLETLPEGVPGLALWVLAGNSRGRRFYERAGFTADGTTETVDIGGERLQELRYRLQLS
jgi:GNAT superfamily N-acetyltransferase